MKNSSSLGRFQVAKTRPFSQNQQRNYRNSDNNNQQRDSKGFKRLGKFVNFDRKLSTPNQKFRYQGVLPNGEIANRLFSSHSKNLSDIRGKILENEKSQKNSFYVSGAYRSKKAPKKSVYKPKGPISLNITNLRIEIDSKKIPKFEKKKLSLNRNYFIHEKLKKRPQVARAHNMNFLFASRLMKSPQDNLKTLKNRFFKPQKNQTRIASNYKIKGNKSFGSAIYDSLAIYKCEY